MLTVPADSPSTRPLRVESLGEILLDSVAGLLIGIKLTMTTGVKLPGVHGTMFVQEGHASAQLLHIPSCQSRIHCMKTKYISYLNVH